MNLHFKHAPLMALLVLSISGGLTAQDLRYGAKFGAGAVVGAIGEQGSRATVNAAFLVEYPLGKSTELFGELNYRVFKSVDHEVTKFGTGYTSTGATGTIVPTTSVDIRKDNLEGIALNFGYRRQFMESLFWWQGGLSLASMVSQQEVTGQITVGAEREGLNFTPGKRSLRPGLFIGAQAKINPNFFVEANLFGTPYQQINYVPRSYTGLPATTVSTNKFKISLDVNIGFRF